VTADVAYRYMLGLLGPEERFPVVSSPESPTPKAKPQTAPPKRVALAREEAAAVLGMSLDSFERYVQPDIAMIRRGRMRLVPVAELTRWANEMAEKTIR